MPDFGYKKMFDHLNPHIADYEALKKLATVMSNSITYPHATRIESLQRNIPNILEFLVFFADQPKPIPAGYTYLSQFIAHDISFDSRSERHVREDRPWNTDTVTQSTEELIKGLRNLRKPSFDLETIYGYVERTDSTGFQRPDFEPLRHELMQEHPLPLLKLDDTLQTDGKISYPCDLPRKYNSVVANIVDPRNDENLLLAQTQVAFIKFHNALVVKLSESEKYKNAAGEYKKDELFNKARELTIRYYQTIILTDFLPRIVQNSVLADVLIKAGTKELVYQPESNEMFIPLEFSVAAFRFGHSMIRSLYELNVEKSGEEAASLDNLMMFTGRGKMDQNNSRKNLPSIWLVNWNLFYELNGSTFNIAEKIDTELVLDLLTLTPRAGNNEDGLASSLAAIDLFRGHSFGLPTGQDVANKIPNVTPLSAEQITTLIMRKEVRDVNVKPEEVDAIKEKLCQAFSQETPLWFYILAEAEIQNDGKLGAVGSRIIAETFIQLLYYSEYSILPQTVETEDFLIKYGKKFSMAEMLKFIQEVNEEHFSILYPKMTRKFDELNPLG